MCCVLLPSITSLPCYSSSERVFRPSFKSPPTHWSFSKPSSASGNSHPPLKFDSTRGASVCRTCMPMPGLFHLANPRTTYIFANERISFCSVVEIGSVAHVLLLFIHRCEGLFISRLGDFQDKCRSEHSPADVSFACIYVYCLYICLYVEQRFQGVLQQYYLI